MPKIEDIRAAVAEAVGKTDAKPVSAGAPDESAPEPVAAKPKPKKPAKPKPAEEPAEDEADEAEAELKTYRVELVYNPPLEVEARDRLEAIEKYNEKCGILSTIHKHKVKLVKAETDE